MSPGDSCSGQPVQLKTTFTSHCEQFELKLHESALVNGYHMPGYAQPVVSHWRRATA